MHSDSNENDCDHRGLVGLQNLGNTCYINSALQALSNCQQLTRFILDCPQHFKDRGMIRCYSELMEKIWNQSSLDSSTYATPSNFIRNIRSIYPAFRGCTQQDTQEFLRCFLEQLHDELKQQQQHQQPPQQSKSLLSSETMKDESGNVMENCFDSQGDVKTDSERHNLIANATADTSTNNGDDDDVDDNNIKNNNATNDPGKSIITDIFEFKISSSVVCSSCNNISTRKETFKDLSIPIPSRDHPYYNKSDDKVDTNFDNNGRPTTSGDSLEESDNQDDETDPLSELSNNNRGFFAWFYQYFSNWLWGPQVTLKDCLSIFFGSDPLEGDNEYSCEVCTKKNRGVKYLKILELPEVLCIHFKRYESIGSAKITTHVSFPLTGLDLAQFMSENSKPQCTTYNLIACICHHGTALLTGHYTTYALNCYDDQWYEFDDQYVSSVQDYQVENSEAYILFYQKSPLDDRTDKQRTKANKLLQKNSILTKTKKFFISKQWVNRFNTFVEPGPITNFDFLCLHNRIPKSKQHIVGELVHEITEIVWKYLFKLHGGGPECKELIDCETCE